MKKNFKVHAVRILAIVLAALFIFGMIGVYIFDIGAADAKPEFLLDTLKTEDYAPGPIPLLCLRVSFDANGNGKDDWKPGNPEMLYGNKDSEFYGEQWIHSSVPYWQNMLFGTSGKTLYTFYSDMTGGDFYFYAANENEGTENDGIVDVVLNMKHPRATSSSMTGDCGERRAAIIAASEYVDFEAFDKDGNGFVDYTELAIVFVIAGYEHAYNSGGKLSSMEAFGTHAHYTSGSGVKIGNVSVTASGHSGFVKVGEYQTMSSAISVGTVAHELGHFLGAYDLYDGSSTWTLYVATLSLMANGSHNNASGEARGATPSFFDPFHSVMIGFTQYETVGNGEYTLYSRESTEGEYNILRVNTPDPKEYYLIENRYASSASRFDNTVYGDEGIIIWHIDDGCVARGKVNTSTSGHDPGVVVMAPMAISATNSAYSHGEGDQSAKYTFNASNKYYKFPLSQTWYTSLDENDAENFALKIETLDPASPKMRIKITGAVDSAPLVDSDNAHLSEISETSIKIYGKINDLCGGDATECGVILSKNSNPTAENGTVVYAVPDEYGRFDAYFDGLEQGTKYYYKIFASGKYGTGTKTLNTYTKFPPKEEVEYDYYNVYLYSNYNNMARKFTIYVYPGETIHYKLGYEWAGYTFCGWYWDAALNERYDMSYTQETKDNYSLYGKWVKNADAIKLNVIGAETEYNFATEYGTAFPIPTLIAREGYTLGGFFADENMTVPFDFEEPGYEDTNVYVKWIKESSEPETTTASSEETTATTVPSGTTASDNNGGCASVCMPAACVGVICAVFSAFVIRRKKND
ncbi:MAG: hypothetical protein KBS59_06750 [Clostridiales bacterium]|nr:hypothetical protein [Clostridiales bacterium]